ncbi:MAG: hypothetical protein RR718_08310, partial [Comamonas sp.]
IYSHRTCLTPSFLSPVQNNHLFLTFPRNLSYRANKQKPLFIAAMSYQNEKGLLLAGLFDGRQSLIAGL